MMVMDFYWVKPGFFIKMIGILVFILLAASTLVSSSSVQQAYYHAVESCADVETFSVTQITTRSRILCALVCSEDASCLSFNLDSGQGICNLNNVILADTSCSQGQFKHYSRDLSSENPCFHGGTYDSVKMQCRCYHGYIGEICEKLMQDCSEGFNSRHYGDDKEEGVFSVHPSSSPFPFKIYCLMSSKGRTTFLNRIRDWPEVNFNRTWSDYRDGFGDLTGSHWLGNQKLYYLTNNNREVDLKTVALTDMDNKRRFRQRWFYDFKLLPESEGYRFTFASHKPKDEHAMGDCMTPVQGYSFSTIDRDNDGDTENCAAKHLSGWWYSNCGPCNPTGRLQPMSDLYQHDRADPTYITAPVNNSTAVREFYIYLRFQEP